MNRYTSRPDAYFVKEAVEQHEEFMHKYIYQKKITGLNVPKPVMYNKKTKQFVMAKIDGMSVSDMYGETVDLVPDEVFDKIRDIMVKLVANGIEYPDFTGYNFVIDNNIPDKIWVIDFEHATINTNIENEFILDICEGEKRWNLDFK